MLRVSTPRRPGCRRTEQLEKRSALPICRRRHIAMSPHHLFRNCTLAAALGLIAACGDRVTPPTSDPTPTTGPSFALGVPFNDQGACLAADAFNSGATSGVSSVTTLADPTKSCTSNDVRVASADVIEYSFDGQTYTQYTGQTVTCNVGTPIFVKVAANLE